MKECVRNNVFGNGDYFLLEYDHIEMEYVFTVSCESEVESGSVTFSSAFRADAIEYYDRALEGRTHIKSHGEGVKVNLLPEVMAQRNLVREQNGRLEHMEGEYKKYLDDSIKSYPDVGNGDCYLSVGLDDGNHSVTFYNDGNNRKLDRASLLSMADHINFLLGEMVE